YLLRVYAPEDYLARWRLYFAQKLGFGSIPGGDGPATDTDTRREAPADGRIDSAEGLRAWMARRGLNQVQAAEALGIGRVTLNHSLTGPRRWTPKFQSKVNTAV